MAASKHTEKLIESWGVEIDPELLKLALIHRSYANEAGGIAHNERLEFLGDAVLQLVVTDRLFTDYPTHPEGHLAKMRAATVSQVPLAQVARQLRLGDYLYLGRGEEISRGRNKDSILSDALEALIGATYLSVGISVTRQVVEAQLRDLLDHAVERSISMDWKTRIQELTRDLNLPVPEYSSSSTGPDHMRMFSAEVHIGSKRYGTGQGRAKKIAEQEAAHAAILKLAQRFNVRDATSLDGYVIGAD